MGFFETYLNVITFSSVTTYLMFVYVIGPRLMKNRPAFKLKFFIGIYNVFQVAACLYVIDYTWKLTSWDIFRITQCIDYHSNTPQGEIFDDLIYKMYLLKLAELIDTVIFVLRKKRNQISYLHVFHHSTVITLVHMSITTYKGKSGLFSVYLNSWIHVVMYSYYFFANICSAETMRKYILIKKSITIMQMIQFVLILIQNAISWRNCDINTFGKYYYCFVIVVLLYGFYDFYKKAYTSKKNMKLENKTK